MMNAHSIAFSFLAGVFVLLPNPINGTAGTLDGDGFVPYRQSISSLLPETIEPRGVPQPQAVPTCECAVASRGFRFGITIPPTLYVRNLHGRVQRSDLLSQISDLGIIAATGNLNWNTR